MDISYRQLNQVSAPELCEISRSIFADYINGPYQMQIEEAEHILEGQYVDLECSQILEIDGRPIGYALVSLNADLARVASMGFRPEVRGKGIGRLVLETMKGNLKRRGFRSLELEAFEQNIPAIRLYASQGFSTIRRLFGFSGSLESADLPEKLTAISTQEAADFCAAFDECELPWQISAWRLRHLADRNLAWKLNEFAIAVTSKPQTDRISLTTLMIHPQHRREGLGRKLMQAIQDQFPDKTIAVPQLCPEEADPFFSSLGFKKLQLNQIQMRLLL